MSSDLRMERLYLIDASSFLYASYYAISGMTRSDGMATNGLYGFVHSMEKLIADFKPVHMAVIYDGKRSNEQRRLLYPEYKMHRTAAPPELLQQLDWSRLYCRYRGLPQLELEGYEADDLIATVAVWAANLGTKVFICSGDKDLCQLVGEQIVLIDPKKGYQLVDRGAVEARHGVAPHQMRDYLAIRGDSADNVPGLPGFGPKKTAKLLQEVGSLDNLLANPSLMGSAKGEKLLREHVAQLKISQQLVTLDRAIPVDLLPQGLDEQVVCRLPMQRAQLVHFFKEMDFRSLLAHLGEAEQLVERARCQGYQIVDDEEDLERLIANLRGVKQLYIHVEGTSLDPMEARLVGVSLCWEEGVAYYLPCYGQLGADRVLGVLKPLLEGGAHQLGGHQLKYQLHLLENSGIRIASVAFDTMLASHLLAAHQGNPTLDELVMDYLGKSRTSMVELLGKGKEQKSIGELAIEQLADYCCQAVDDAFQLGNCLEAELLERGMEKLFCEIEMPLVKLLQKMERTGIYLDVKLLALLGDQLRGQLEQFRQLAYSAAGQEFNLNSPIQIGEIFAAKGIKTGKKSKRGLPATGADELLKVRDRHPLAHWIYEYRLLEKLRSTYVDALPQLVNRRTGRLHCTFHQSGTVTGRLSSSHPNLQNIPARSPLSLRIREAFRPEEAGWVFLAADYSQIELRLLAHMSGDARLIEAFQQGEDIHRHTASCLFGLPLEEVTAEMRQRAKAVNFGLIYGQQAYGLSSQIGVDLKEAEQFMAAYFARYPAVEHFVTGCKERAREKGKSSTLWGRERLLPEIKSSSHQARLAAERLAINGPIQGTAADLIKRAMVQIDQQIEQRGWRSRMVLQIHDELLFELPEEELEPLTALVKEQMEQVASLSVPLVVDIAVGKNWKEC